MTIKLKAPAKEAKAQIVSINLPSELEAGAWITGTIVVKNVGEAVGYLRLVITWWDGSTSTAGATVSVGYTMTVTIPEGHKKMPNHDISTRFDAQHQRPDGTFVTDDTKTH